MTSQMIYEVKLQDLYSIYELSLPGIEGFILQILGIDHSCYLLHVMDTPQLCLPCILASLSYKVLFPCMKSILSEKCQSRNLTKHNIQAVSDIRQNTILTQHEIFNRTPY